MGLEEIVGQVGKEASAKVRDIIEQAHADALKIKDQADDEASQYLKERKAAADYEAKQLAIRENSKAKVEAKGIYRDKIAEILGNSFSTLIKELNLYVASEEYVKLLSKLFILTQRELGDNCTIYMLDRDLKRVKFPGNVNKGALKEETLGGLKGVSEDGKMYVDFTIESVVELLRDSMSAKAMKLVEKGVDK